jgi:hypothetical protein
VSTSNPEPLVTTPEESEKAQPIEVWLTQPHLEVTCRIVYEDERTDALPVGSLSMRGAQREVTGFLINKGYTPVGRWEIERDSDGVATETSRRFKPGHAAPNLLETEEDRSSSGISTTADTGTGEFHFYENWTNTYALVHRGSCPFCNRGRGTQGRGSETASGKWHGPFGTFDEAVALAREAIKVYRNRSVWIVRPCGTCLGNELRRNA